MYDVLGTYAGPRDFHSSRTYAHFLLAIRYRTLNNAGAVQALVNITNTLYYHSRLRHRDQKLFRTRRFMMA